MSGSSPRSLHHIPPSVEMFCSQLGKHVKPGMRELFEDDKKELGMLCSKLTSFLQTGNDRAAHVVCDTDVSLAMVRECDALCFNLPLVTEITIQKPYTPHASCSISEMQASPTTRQKVHSAAIVLLQVLIPDLHDEFLDVDSIGAAADVQTPPCSVCKPLQSLSVSSLHTDAATRPTGKRKLADQVTEPSSPGANRQKVAVGKDLQTYCRTRQHEIFKMTGEMSSAADGFFGKLDSAASVPGEREMDYCLQWGFATGLFGGASYSFWTRQFQSPRQELKDLAVRTHMESVYGATCYALVHKFHGTSSHLRTSLLSQLVLMKCPCLLCTMARGMPQGAEACSQYAHNRVNYMFDITKLLESCQAKLLHKLGFAMCSVTPMDVQEKLQEMFCRYRCQETCLCNEAWACAQRDMLCVMQAPVSSAQLHTSVFSIICDVLCEAQVTHQCRMQLHKAALQTRLALMFESPLSIERFEN